MRNWYEMHLMNRELLRNRLSWAEENRLISRPRVQPVRRGNGANQGGRLRSLARAIVNHRGLRAFAARGW